MTERRAGCRLRILGIGSPFGADRLGWDVVERLNAQPLPDGVEAVSCAHPISELLPQLEGIDAAIVVDAMAGVPAGKVVRCRLRDLRDGASPHSIHGLSVVTAVDLAMALGMLPPSLEILGLGIGESGSHPNSGDLDSALPRMVHELRTVIGERLDGWSRPRRHEAVRGDTEVTT